MISEKEALASLKILAAIARADGSVLSDERKSLGAALDNLDIPGGVTVDALLAETVDVKQELATLESEEAREQIYRSAYFMAHADGTCTKEEQALLDIIADATGTTAETRLSLDRMFVGRASQGELLSISTQKISDPTLRASEVQAKILRYSVLTAALGAFPIPVIGIATDLAVVALQLKMIRDIGGYWGHTLDMQAAKSMLYGVGLGTGARLALANLAKLVPGWGSVLGATTAFISTYALGKAMDKMFASGEALNPEVVRASFRAAEEEARSVYAGHEDVIIESQRANKATFEALSAELRSGKITQADFDAKVAALA